MNKKGISIALISETSKAAIYGFQKFESDRSAILVSNGVEAKHLISLGETVAVQVGDFEKMTWGRGPKNVHVS